MNEEKLYTNKRLLIAELLIWIAVCMLVYLGFIHIRGVTGLEELILAIFLLLVLIWRGSRLLQFFPTIVLSAQGITYRTDFKSWEEIKHAELVPAKFGLAATRKLRLSTTIQNREEVVWSITAADCGIDLEQLLERINHYQNLGSETLQVD